MAPHPVFRVTAEALVPGTSVRYHHRSGDSLATVVRRSADYVTFVGEECDGTFNYDQIDRLLDEGRLQVVLDDEHHLPTEVAADRPLDPRSRDRPE